MKALGKSPGAWIAMVLLAAAFGVQSAGGVSQAVTLRIGSAAVSPDSTVRVGQLVTWRIQFSNGGPDTAAAAKIVFHTSGVHISAVAAGSTVGACSGTSCTLGDLYVGENETLTVSGTPTATGKLDWDATLSSNNSNVGVGRAGTVTVVAQRADLSMTAKPPATSAKTGQPIAYAFAVAGHGPDVAKNTKLTFHETGPHLSNVRFTINGAAASCLGWTCPLGNLGPAGIAKVTLTATPTQIGTLLWDATAASSAADPTPADATRSGFVLVGSPHANLSVQLTPAPPAVAVAHEFLQFHLVVHNGGPETAVGANVKWQALGIHLDEFGIGGSGGSSCSSGGGCNLGDIGPGKNASVGVSGRPATTGAMQYTLTASSKTADPDPSNNRATGTVAVNPAIADLGVTVTVPATGHVNTALLFYFKVRNAGPTLAPRLKFTFHASGPHLTNLAWGPFWQQFCAGNNTCLTGDMSVNSAGLEFSAVPTQTGTLSWTMQVTSDATDPIPSNSILGGQITIN